MRCRPLILVLLFLIIFMNTACSGCWNRREVQQLTIGTGIGIDVITIDGKQQFRLSVLALQTAESSTVSNTTQMGSGSNTGSAQVISAEGDTIYDAVRNWNLRSSRQLFLGHTWIVVLGKSVTSERLAEVLDFLNRHKDIRFRTQVLVYDGFAEEALQAQPEFETITSLEVQQLILQNGPRVSKAGAVNIFQMSYDLLTPSRELVLPRLQVITPPEKLRQAQTLKEELINSVDTPDKVVIVTGSGVYRGFQHVGWLNVDETQGMLLIKNEFKGGIIPLTVFGQNYSILLGKASSKIEIDNEQESLVINVKITGTGAIQEGGSAINEITPQRIKQYEEALNRAVTLQCNKALSKSRELRVDIFGFGDNIHRYKPQLWKRISDQWEEMYPGININISCDLKIDHYGPVR